MTVIPSTGVVGVTVTQAGTPETGVQGLWKLDETSGTTLVDATGFQNNGTYSPGGVTLQQDALVAVGSSYSVLFDGAAGYASIPDNSQYGNLTAYTVSLLVQPSSLPADGSNRCIFQKDKSVGNLPGRLSIEQYNDGGTSKLRAFAGSTTSSAQWIGSNTGVAELPVDEAHRVTVTVHATDGSRLYLDDHEVANASGGQAWQQVIFPFLIGAHLASDGTSPESFFHGFIDEVTIWPYRLSALEVAALPAAVTIAGSGGAPSPAASNDSFGPFTAGTTQNLDVLANDSNLISRTITIETQPSAGTVSTISNGTSAAQARYLLPSPTGQTVYQFTYSVDGSNVVTVSVTVNGTSTTAPNFFTSTAIQAPYVHTSPLGTDATQWSPDPPAYNAANPKAATFIPSPWGCKMVRLTGYPGTPILINGTTDSGLTFDYTHGHGVNCSRGLDCFNADGSLFLIGVPTTHGGRTMLLEGNTFLIKRVRGSSVADLGFNPDFGFWHPTIANRYIEVIGPNNTIVFRYWAPSTNTLTNGNVRTITAYRAPSSQGQGRRCANDGNRVAMLATRNSDGKRVFFGYDIGTGFKTSDWLDNVAGSAPDGAPYEGCVISADGQYLQLGRGPYNGVPGGRAADIWTFDNPSTYVGPGPPAQMKHSHGQTFNGEAWKVGAGAASLSGVYDTGDMVAFRLSDGTIKRLTSIGFFDYTGCGFDERYSYGTSTHGSELGTEIIAVRIDGSSLNNWRRLGPHRAYIKNIRDQPDPVGSRNGDMVIFDTNWQGPDISTISSRRFPVMIYDLISHNGWDGG